MGDPLSRFSPLFYAAAAYNLGWGLTIVLASSTIAWQVVGMFVFVYAPAYWWTARRPSQHADLVGIGTLGKVLGTIGFAWAAASGRLPIAFGLTVFTNDIIWLPGFALYLRAAARLDDAATRARADLVPPSPGSPPRPEAREGARAAGGDGR